jgi:hypothetical protein
VGTKSFEDAKPEIEKQIKPEMAQKNMQDLEKKANVQLDPEFFGTQKQ